MNDLTILAMLAQFKKELASIERTPGPKGEHGEKGDQGQKGEEGERGRDGLDGADGKTGASGKDGNDGKDGVGGVGIEDIQLEADDSLTFKYSDGTETNIEFDLAKKSGDTYISTTGSSSRSSPDQSPIPSGNPSFTYADEILTRIDYGNGSYKVLTYTSGLLTKLVFTTSSSTLTKNFFYNPDGTLSNIVEN